jgi:hypothetical protein
VRNDSTIDGPAAQFPTTALKRLFSRHSFGLLFLYRQLQLVTHMDKQLPTDRTDSVEHSSRLIRLWEYNEAYGRLFGDVILMLQSKSPILEDVKPIRSRHCGPFRNYRGPSPLDQPMMAGGFGISISKEAVQETDIDAHVDMIYKAGSSHLEAITPLFSEHLRQLTNATGNVVSGGGPPTLAALREILSKISLSFDEDGTLQPLQVIIPPELKESAQKAIEEMKSDAECQAIVEQRRKEYFASKRSRKLS